MPSLIEAETIWSCTTCRACVEECPMLIEHVDAIVGMRRSLNLVRGEVPGQAAETLANLRETETQGGFANDARYNWAADLDVKAAKPGVPVDVLFIAGEGAFEMRYQRTLRALIKTLKAAKVDFAVLGDLERDSGDTARRLGDEATFQALARRNIETLASIPFRRIVTPDPHVLHSLKNEYRALGGNYTVLHHTTFLASLVDKGRLALKPSGESRRLTYHDPCLSRALQRRDRRAPRSSAQTRTERERNGTLGAEKPMLRRRRGRGAHRHPGQARGLPTSHR